MKDTSNNYFFKERDNSKKLMLWQVISIET